MGQKYFVMFFFAGDCDVLICIRTVAKKFSNLLHGINYMDSIQIEAVALLTRAQMPPKCSPTLEFELGAKNGRQQVTKSYQRAFKLRKLAGTSASAPTRQDPIGGAGSPRQPGHDAQPRL
jgi:hypothetical protein